MDSHVRFTDVRLQQKLFNTAAQVWGGIESLTSQYGTYCDRHQYSDCYCTGSLVPISIYNAATNGLRDYSSKLGALIESVEENLTSAHSGKYMVTDEIRELLVTMEHLVGRTVFREKGFRTNGVRYSGTKTVRCEIVDFCIEEGRKAVDEIGGIFKQLDYPDAINVIKKRVTDQSNPQAPASIGEDSAFVKDYERLLQDRNQLDSYVRLYLPVVLPILTAAVEQSGGVAKCSRRTGIPSTSMVNHLNSRVKNIPVSDFRQYLKVLRGPLPVSEQEYLPNPMNRMRITSHMKSFVTKTIKVIGEKLYDRYDRASNVRARIYGKYLERQDLDAMLLLGKEIIDTTQAGTPLQQQYRDRKMSGWMSSRKTLDRMYELIGVDRRTQWQIGEIYHIYPEFNGNVFIAKQFASIGLTRRDLSVAAIMYHHSGASEEELVSLSGVDEKSFRKVANKLFDKGLAHYTKEELNKEDEWTRGWIHIFWHLDDQTIARAAEVDRGAVRKRLREQYQSLDGSYFRCDQCSSILPFEELADGRCGCGSLELEPVDEHPDRAIIQKVFRAFIDEELC